MKRGFSLVELIVALAIFVILVTVAVVNLGGGRRKAELESATKAVAALLREAQSNAMAQAQGVGWGVHFENATTTAPFYALFASSTYSASVIVGYYRLPPSVGYVASTLGAGSSTNITFGAVIGTASASTSIGLYSLLQPSLSSTIAVASSGVVGY